MRVPIQVLVYPVRKRSSAQKRNWECLLLKRIPRREGFWQGVTGAPLEGESLKDAAQLELFEETKLTPLSLVYIDFSYTIPLLKATQSRFLAVVQTLRVQTW